MVNADERAQAQESLRRLEELWDPPDAALREVFAEVPAAVGVPGVHLVWRLLANFPSFLVPLWPALAARLSSAPLRATARDLTRASLLADAVGMPSHKAFRGDMVRAEIDAELREQIEHFNDLSQAGVARLLALAAAMHEGLSVRPSPAAPEAPASFVPGPVPGVYVPPLRHGEARGKAAEVLATIEREHGLPFLDDYYRSLARIPDYLSAAWNAIRPIVGDPAYLELAASLQRSAGDWSGADRVAAVVSTALQACGPAEQGLIRLVLDVSAGMVLPQTLVDITLIKALTSGPDRAMSPSS